MRILVTGASGFVGRPLVASLCREDKSVTILARGAAASAAGADVFAGPADLASIDDAPDWPAGIDTVIHLAALNPARRAPADEAALRHANVDGTAALARRAARQGVRRMIFVSTANVHAPGTAVAERDALAPQSAYARSKAEAEAAFWQALSGSTTEGCVLRPAPVYGPGGRGNVASLVRLARLPLPLPIGNLGGRRSLLALDGLVDVLRLAVEAEGAAGETFLVADPGDGATPGDVVRALRRGWGRRENVPALSTAARALLSKVLGTGGPMADFTLDTHHLAERTGWRPGAGSTARLEAMAAAGEL